MKKRKEMFVGRKGELRELKRYWPYDVDLPELARKELLDRFNRGESIEGMSGRMQFLLGKSVHSPDAVAVHEAVLVTYLLKNKSKLSPQAIKRLSGEIERLKKQGAKLVLKSGGKLIDKE